MFRSLYRDMPYLENKYHRTGEPFDPYRRMDYHGGEYDESTGLGDEEMDRGLRKLAEEVSSLPHPVAKARLFAFVLANARIDVNDKDWFVGFYNWGRPLRRYTTDAWSDEVFAGLPGIRDEIALFQSVGAAAIWPDFDHVIPNWEALLGMGFAGLLERVRDYHRRWGEKGMTPEQDAFFEGMEISYEAVLALLDRYYRYALTRNSEKSAKQAACLKHLRDGSPSDLYEALQAIYLFFLLCECVDNYQTRSLGNGIDSTLLRFWRKDIESGAYTEEEEREFLAYFLMQFSSIGNYWGHPMYMGGTDADGNTRFNEVSEAILDIYGELKLSNPKVQIKVAENTPKEILFRVFDLIRTGVSPFVFCCEPGHRRAVMAYGATAEEARDFEISGCYETRVRSDESSTSVSYINAAKAVEFALTDGKDMMTGKEAGLKTGDVSEFRSFGDFYFAFLRQWDHLIEESIRIGNSYEGFLAHINPSNLYSATIRRSLERGVDGYAFGVKFNNSAILNCGFASAVDSLMAVKKLCFETSEVSLPRLAEILQNDWEGCEVLRQKAFNLPFKYGNAEPETDLLAAGMADYFSGRVNNRPNARGGVYKAIMHSAMQFVWQGAKTGALPDGHRAGAELSKNASPVSGADRKGVTALIRSALKLNPSNYHESFCVDLMLHPSSVEGEKGLEALYGLLMAYLENGGMSMQFNIFDTDTLRDAQKHPEKYRSLQVRVCGWNARWNDLPTAEQDAFILRSEHIL